MNPTAQLLEPEIRELVREGRFVELREALCGLEKADVADILSELAPSEGALAFRFLPHDDAGEVFAYLKPEAQEALIHELGAEGAVRVVDAMSADDRVRLIDELPAAVAQRLIASLPPRTRHETQAILGYPPKSVGRLMTPDYITLHPTWTIARALEEIRLKGRDAETINVVYIVDEQGRLIDDIRIRQIILADPSQPVESLMNRSFVALRADQHQAEAVDAMSRYDRIALPVVDTRGVMIGIVTSDDVADVAQRQFTEEVQKLGGVEALDEPYLQTPLRAMVRKRGLWLGVLFMGESVTILVLSAFDWALDQAVVLAVLAPLIIASGGNSGSQAGSLVIRALALKEVAPSMWRRVLVKELFTGLVLGSFLGVIGVVLVLAWDRLGIVEIPASAHVAFVVGTAIVGCVIWGTFLGAMLPLGLRRLGLDPAAASTPLVATTMDCSGMLIYLTVAIFVLRGVLISV